MHFSYLDRVPRQPDLTGYEKIYNKRIQTKNPSHDLVQSLGDAHNGCQVLMAIMKTMNLKVVKCLCFSYELKGN